MNFIFLTAFSNIYRLLVPKSVQTCGRILFLVVLFTSNSLAQKTLSNQRQKTIQVRLPQQQIDSLTIIPHTVGLVNLKTKTLLDTSFYQIDNNFLVWNFEKTKTIPAFESQEFQIQYRVFPYQFTARKQHLDTLKMERLPDDSNYIGYDYSPYKKEVIDMLDQPNLNYSGSFSRGISVGNSQSLVLNSSFNLQMAGKVDDVEILAAISDSNIPLQPEGNTQQLQDFDKVFIQVKKDNHQLLAGDYEIANSDNYFLKYYKKLQGASYTNTSTLGEQKRLVTQASAAIARGKFARNTLVVQEGNQGPYRLQGTESERFIILLAGTERVYVDGQLKKRGIEYDYVIDYNRGDITFTANQLITKDRRVIVEFEYSSQNFLRTLTAVKTEYKSEKLRLHFNVFSQQDSKNTSGLTELTATDKQVLVKIGDQTNEAFVSGLRDASESENPIRYDLVDTLHNGVVYDSVLVFSAAVDAAYTARFSDVGAGNGNYIRDATAINGTVFIWIAPDETGQLQGNFAPIIQLAAPLSHQIYSVGLEYQLSKKSQIQTEFAMSNYDLNRFSRLDAADNFGMAAMTKYRFETPLSRKDSIWVLGANISYEYKQKHFQQLNPYRNPEFNRDWNIANIELRADEHIGKARVSLQRKNIGKLDYELSSFLRSHIYTGTRHFSQLDIQKNDFRLLAESNLLNTESDTEKTQFFRPKIDLSKSFSKLKNLQIGTYVERERNARTQADTLTQNSFHYDLLRFYIQTKADEKWLWNANFTQRWDAHPLVNKFEEASKANSFALNGNWNQSRASRLRWNFTYRQLDIRRQDLTEEQALETYLGKLEYNLALWKGALKSNTTYEIGAGQEPRLEYNYLKVNAGEGVYQWNDYNLDSLQQVNEFEIAINQDQAEWVRVTVLTNDFIRTNNVGFNQSLSLNPRAIWHKKTKGVYPFLKRFSSQSIFKINRKTRHSEEVELWNPFQQTLADTSLVATSASIRNTLFFNRTSPKYDLQIGQFQNENQVVLTTGYENRNSKEQFFKARWNTSKSIKLETYLAQGKRSTDSQFFDERDYDILYQKIEQIISFQASKNWRSEGSFLYQKKQNQLDIQQALQREFFIKTTFNQSTKTAIQAEAGYTQISYVGELNTAIAFALLESLQPGRNYSWNLTFDRQIAKHIQLNVGYEGRKNGDLQIVHIGRAQVRAIF